MQILSYIHDIPTSYIREILKVVEQKSIISLAGGLPDISLFPQEIIQEALSKSANTYELFQYGQTRGYPPLLKYIAQQLQVENQQVLITSGAQQGLDLCLRGFVGPNDKVVVETPCYLGALQAMRFAQANVVSIDSFETGPDLEQLETCFRSNSVRCFYAVPDFSNPTGHCWDLDTRLKVAELCQRYSVILIEDSPYRELRFSGQQLPLVSSMCPENSVLLSSFSKTVLPSLRVAALIAPNRWLKPLEKMKQAMDLHTSTLTQFIILEALQHPLYENALANTINQYHKRYCYLAQSIEGFNSERLHHTSIEGGMFLWLKCEARCSQSIASKLLTAGVAVVPSSEFMLNAQQAYPTALRLSFSNSSVTTLDKACRIIHQVFKHEKLL